MHECDKKKLSLCAFILFLLSVRVCLFFSNYYKKLFLVTDFHVLIKYINLIQILKVLEKIIISSAIFILILKHIPYHQ